MRNNSHQLAGDRHKPLRRLELEPISITIALDDDRA
jgi:hypothetical protein